MKNRFLLPLLCFFLISCGDDDKISSETDNLFKFKEYISFHSYGNRSIADPIRIELAKPLEQFEVDQEISLDYLKIRPKTPGKLMAVNGQTLIFKPEEFLKPGTEYSLTLKLDELYEDIEKDFEEFTFAFKTIEPNFKINLGNLQSYDEDWQYLSGTVETSDVVSPEKARKLVSAKQNGNTLKLKWDIEKNYAKFFNFRIDSIKRKTDDSKILITWNGESIDAESEGENHFQIPGKNNFSIVNMESRMAPQATLAINFSDPILENQDFSGLVNIENAQNLRFEVDGNMLYVYPPTRIVGKVRVNIFEGIQNTAGYALKEGLSELVSFEQLKPEVRLVSKGVILPNSASTPVYFEAVNLAKVDVRIIKIFENNILQFLQSQNLDATGWYDINRVGRRVAKKTIVLEENAQNNGLWNAYAINLSKMFEADPGALYRLEISFKKEYSLYPCNGETDKETPQALRENLYADMGIDEEEIQEQRYWDNEIYRWRRYSYNWQERDNPCHEAYYNEDRVVSTNLLGSNLGLIVKEGNNKSYHFAATNLLTSKPETGVKIKLYNYQQQLIANITAEKNGLALFDSQKDVAFVVAQKGNDYAYAKLEDGNALSLSNFDIAGKQLQRGFKSFLYTERGVHRPGDTIHLTFVLNDNNNPLPKEHPIKLEVTDARGRLAYRKILTDNSTFGDSKAKNGFYYFPIPTKDTDPTGNWRAEVSVGGAKFHKNLRVATVKPNRLKIELGFDDKILEADKAVRGNAKVNWLHGAPARNLDIEMKATLRQNNQAFENHPGYKFNDPVRSFDETEIAVLDSAQLSAAGTIDFSKEIKLGNKAPGMLDAVFLTKVFEGGGDFSIDVMTKKLAPYSHFVGLRSPEARRYGSYYTDEDVVFGLLSVDAQGNPSGNRELEVKVFKIEWRWWWNRGRDNLSRYENATIHQPVQSFQITTGNDGKSNFMVNIPEEEGGRYLVRVTDKKSGHATGRVAYFYRNWWRKPSDGNSEAAKMLLFSSDKEKYAVGEKAHISFPSSEGGHALVSIENGTEVLSTKWVETEKNETKISVELTPEMTPNIYVNISLLQPYQQTKNDLPMRLYGVVPILVENPATRLNPKLDMPDVLRPEETFSVKVSEKNGKAMTYTLAVVDEGLLDLTRFQTPAIHKAFYTREALGVKTFDIYDYVIGAYSGSVDNIYAIGGGDVAAGAKNRKADRFKPVVRFLGPFELAAGKTASHKIKMPNYIGSVRTMIVAGDNEKSAYGNAEKTTPVRTPLMVLASLPRKLSPGETVTLPVTVFAMENKVKSATIHVKPGAGLKPLDGTSKKVSFDGPGEKIVNFKFEVLPGNSVQKIEVTASGNGEKSRYETEIDVVNPNPISRKSTLFTLDGNEEETIEFQTFGVPGSNFAQLEFSTLPPMDFDRRLDFLIRYPHGCVEQITSGVFPQLFLGDVLDLTYSRKQKIKKNVEAAIEKLGRYQIPNGGIAYWPGNSDADEWGTSYAGHFMLEAKRKGFALPITFMDNWISFQKNTARQWRANSRPYNTTLKQAYRLYTLALAGQPELAAMNRLRKTNGLGNDAKWRLAAAYALAGKESTAKEIAQTANINFVPKKHDYHTYGSPFRNKAMALETMVILDNPNQRELAISLAKGLSSQSWYSTQETAYALLALAKMVEKNGGKSLELVYVSGNENPVTVKTDRAIALRELSLKMGNNKIVVSNKKDNTVYVSLSQTGKLPLGQELATSRNLSVNTQFLGGGGNPVNISTLHQGTGLTAKITVTNTSGNAVENIALTQIFPSGWEIVNTRFTDLGGGIGGNAEYIDIRDDRVNFYFDLDAGKSKTFTVDLNASYLGRYYLPGTQAEAMYDNTYFVRNKGKWVEVVE